jgi:uncharacterized damage-inducible protein DinB
MNELERTLTGDSAAAPPAEVLKGIGDELVHREIAGAPRTIYAELWHITYWLEMTLDWVDGRETAYPEDPTLASFPSKADVERESWAEVVRRFFAGIEKAAAITRDAARMEVVVRCTSPAGAPVRTMTVREQLESLTAHDAYHFGRIVLMRQMLGAWPPVEVQA